MEVLGGNSEKSDDSVIPAEILDTTYQEKIAIKVFEREDFKLLGRKEYATMKSLEGHPNLLRVDSFGNDGCLDHLKDLESLLTETKNGVHPTSSTRKE